MTRAEIAAHYIIVNGTIRSPGKFEGEPVWAPYALDIVCDGFGEWKNASDCWIRVTDEDRREFPEISSEAVWIQVHETSDGFVYCNELDEGGQPL